jgi:CRP-like cAMP-binding protein
MSPSAVTTLCTRRHRIEDPLEHLPFSKIVEYGKRQVIYNELSGPAGLYLVVSGRVKVSLPAEAGRDVIIDVYRADDFFGESALLGEPCCNERAVALDRARVMMWPTDALANIMNDRPCLPIALLQAMVQRTLSFRARIRNLHAGTVERRLADFLRTLAEQSGMRRNDGAALMLPLTHEVLAQYVGTSREAVTLYMTEFRRKGYIDYSRLEMVVYLDAIAELLRQPL